MIEADGTIIVPKQERSTKGKKNYPAIEIAFNAKDLPLARVLSQIIGLGSIPIKEDRSAALLAIHNVAV